MSSISNHDEQRRAVSFSQYAQMINIPIDRAEVKFYSTEDNLRFQQEMMRDTRRMARKIATTPSEEITHDDLHKCIGIEVFLSPGLLRRTVEKRHTHQNLILERQGVDEDLRSVSERSSSWARDRAHKMATTYTSFGD